jgi:hypothetical protein
VWVPLYPKEVDVAKMERPYELCKIDQLAQKINSRTPTDVLAAGPM